MRIGQIAKALCALDTLLDLADAGEILVELGLIVPAEVALELARILHHEIEQRFLRRLPLAEIRLPLRTRAGAE